MNDHSTFVFNSYQFDTSDKKLVLNYSYEDGPTFSEVYEFDFAFTDYDPAALDRAVQNLFFLAGVSYFKAFIPSKIKVKSGKIDANFAGFLNKTYQKGLGEFFYVNKLDPNTKINFAANSNEAIELINANGKGMLVGIGGGKDSLVSVDILKKSGYTDIATWSVGHKQQLLPLVEKIGLPHYFVERHWDSKLLELNDQGALNGHVPISALFAAIGTVVAILAGKQDSVVSNEHSANEPTLQYQGVSINHQYSKSQEFEEDYQTILARHFDGSQRYYSLLRPLSELRIAELFAQNSFETYKDVFCSCNKAFVRSSNKMSWCGECPKCAFVYLVLSPFIEQSKLDAIWGKNLLQDQNLASTFKQLLGIEGDKPLECIGEIQESRYAMQEIFSLDPSLRYEYIFDSVEGYDFREQKSHSMPEDIYNSIKDFI